MLCAMCYERRSCRNRVRCFVIVLSFKIVLRAMCCEGSMLAFALRSIACFALLEYRFAEEERAAGYGLRVAC